MSVCNTDLCPFDIAALIYNLIYQILQQSGMMTCSIVWCMLYFIPLTNYLRDTRLSLVQIECI